MNTKLQVTGFKLQVNRLGMAGLLALVLVLVLSPSPAEETTGTVTVIKVAQTNLNPYQKLYEEMLYPCVRISTASGVGSGVVITTTDYTDDTDNTYILTAAHVVGNYSSVTVTFYTPLTPLDRGELSATVVMTDTGKDLALLRVLGVSAVKYAKLAPRDYVPYLFTPVWTVGCSLGLPPRPSSGHICAICGSSWEISAPILPGNSGGPVYDGKTYQVIGIVVWVKVYNGQLITTMAGIVPIFQVYEFLSRMNLPTEAPLRDPEVKPKKQLHSGESIESKEFRTPNSINSMNSLDFYPLSRYPEASKTARDVAGRLSADSFNWRRGGENNVNSCKSRDSGY